MQRGLMTRGLAGVWLAAGVVAAAELPPAANVKLHGLFTDDMVLQRDVPIRVSGTADPGGRVVARMGARSAEAAADAAGRWVATLPAQAAGGPYELVIEAAQTFGLKNVMVGDVWVGSGQSNMYWPVKDSNHPDTEIAAADHPNIRLFTVAQGAMPTPQGDLTGQWLVCSPSTVGSFSAVAYCFGRDLHERLNVPIGLIHSSVGGTPAEAWTPWETLAGNPALRPIVDSFESACANYPQARKDYEEALRLWQEKNQGGALPERHEDPGNQGAGEGWASSGFDDSGWDTMDLPGFWERAVAIDGAVWFRRDVDIPEVWADRDLTLALGAIDDYDATYFNGEPVGATGKDTALWAEHPRVYRVPAALAKPGRAVIAVRAFDDVGSGGFHGAATEMRLECRVPEEGIALAGPWRYRVELALDPAALRSGEPAAPVGPDNISRPGGLYNAMIHPLTGFPIRGAIWYQGEANAGAGYLYRTLLPALIGSWRGAWGQADFPFLIVQLANYLEPAMSPGESSWSELREAQAMALALPNTGLAVAIDIGAAGNIHPPNKQDVGRRLALTARRVAYGEEMAHSGPMYAGMKIEGNRVRLSFTSVGAGLAAQPTGAEGVGDGELKRFAIAGEDRAFVWGHASIDGSEVVVWSPETPKPVAVRYAWSENPQGCNLYNREGLPASPFRTDDWPRATFREPWREGQPPGAAKPQ